MKRLILAIPLCLVALGLAPAPAVADPVTLTGGNIFYHEGDPLFVTLPSIGGFIVGGTAVTPSWACSPCAPGDMLNTSVSEDFSTLGAVGAFVHQGTTYQVDSGSFTINSGQVSVPTNLATGPGGTLFAAVFTPFTFTGTLTGVSSGGLTTSLELSGGGTAALLFSQVPGGSPQFFSASYGFESAAAVPEPGDTAAGRCSRGRCRGAAASGQEAGRRVAFTRALRAASGCRPHLRSRPNGSR